MNNKTDDELKQIAIDLRAGRIFCDRQIGPDIGLGSIFMVLALMDGPQIEELKKDPPGMIYEYLHKAGPRSCNGYPGFFSMEMLSVPDTEKVFSLMDKLDAAEKAALTT